MIIDGQAEFRRLLSYHITSQWPDAIVSEYDPTEAGHLPAEFSGAGNDVVLLGDDQGDRDGQTTLRQFLNKTGFPPIVYFGVAAKPGAMTSGASAYIARDWIPHATLIARIDKILRAKTPAAARGDHLSVKGYRILQQFSAGEHAAVYLAEKAQTGRKVVLKVLWQVPDIGEGVGVFDRFLQEYEIIAELDHPNIVQIYDLGISDDQAHIAMEYLPGGDLKQKLRSGVTEAAALGFARQIAGALENLHSVGILHRDLKPGNIMLRDDGSIALIDFGLAKKMQHGLETLAGAPIHGTPYYMSPEQGRGLPVDERSDLYSLGIILYEMLTGKKPFTGRDPMAVIFNHSEAALPLLPRQLSHHQALLDRLLAKKPQDRIQSAAEVLEWL